MVGGPVICARDYKDVLRMRCSSPYKCVFHLFNKDNLLKG